MAYGEGLHMLKVAVIGSVAAPIIHAVLLAVVYRRS